MAADFGTTGVGAFSNVLKNFYLGPIQDQLNEETLVCDMFEKASVDWNGRQVIIPVHLSRNANVGYVAEGQNLPGPADGTLGPVDASQQGYANLVVSAAFLYGRFQITGPAMSAAGKGGANSFVGWVDGEMNRLVADIKNASNRAAISGGSTIGFITHDNLLAAAVATDVTFDGDVAKAALLVAAAPGADQVDIVRMDTYATIGAAEVTGVGLGTLELTAGVVMAAAFPRDPANLIIPCALVLNAAGALTLGTASEPSGIYANLADPEHFGVGRVTVAAPGAANVGAALQCGNGAQVGTVSNMLSTNVADDTRTGIALELIQSAMDRQTLASDTSPDVILMSPLQRTRLAALFQANVQMDANRSAGNADGGFTGFSYAGIPVKTSRHCDNGLLILLDTKTWKMTELESGKFADADGNVLSRVGIVDAWEGFYKWYYEIVCLRPNANSIITGLTL